MLASFNLILTCLQPIMTDRATGPLAHALLLHMIRAVDPAMAAELHGPSPLKPFTVSDLAVSSHRRSHTEILPGETCHLRLTSLTADLFTTMSAALAGELAQKRDLKFGSGQLMLTDVVTDASAAYPLAAITSYADIWEARQPARNQTLTFLSPTTFRQEGVTTPIPIPHLVWQSLLRKWTHFSPIPMPAPLAPWLQTQIAIARYTLQTTAITRGTTPLVGFTGTVRFVVPKPAPDDLLAAWDALSAYATFAGIGWKTTQGMGQVTRKQQPSEIDQQP